MASYELQTAVIPQFFPAQWLKDAPNLVSTDFPSRIRVGYVIRGDGHYSYVMRPALDDSGLSVAELHTAAVGNLRNLPMPDLKVAHTPGGPEAFLTDVNDNFCAVRILLPEVQQALADKLGDEFFVAIPCRDWFVCWNKKQASEWQSRNISDARSDFLEDDYRLTPDIFLRSSAGITLHLAQEA